MAAPSNNRGDIIKQETCTIDFNVSWPPIGASVCARNIDIKVREFLNEDIFYRGIKPSESALQARIERMCRPLPPHQYCEI
jgi:hypothetical protein